MHINGFVFLFDTGIYAERIRVPDTQHAAAGTTADVFEPGAILHRNCSRHFPEGVGGGRALAADGEPGGIRRRDPGLERLALPEDAGLTTATICRAPQALPRALRALCDLLGPIARNGAFPRSPADARSRR